jgi:hypothetical protein
MGTYTRTPLVAGAAEVATTLNTELGKVETAINTLGGTQFAADCVPVSAMANDQVYLPLKLFDDDVAAGLSDSMTDQIVVPIACTAVSIKIVADTIGAGTVDVNIKKNGTTIHSGGLLRIAAADTAYTFTLTTTAFAANDLLQMYFTTQASTGTATIVRVTALFKAQITS